MTNSINYDCYICLENTETYYKSNSCNCKIYCHEKCIDSIITYNRCIICKKKTSIHSLKEIKSWYKNIILKSKTKVIKINLSECKNWNFSKKNIKHKTNKFSS